MKTTKIFILLFLLFAISSCNKEEVIPVQNAPQTVDEGKMLSLVNEWRLKGCNCGSTYFPPVNAVVWNDNLELAAYNHSKDMDDKNFFSHTGSDGSDAGDRLDRVNYAWQTYGENIANGYTSEEAVVKGWIESEGHCKNIMNANFQQMGVAKSGSYWTQVFATPK